jgi:hypothetical protein
VTSQVSGTELTWNRAQGIRTVSPRFGASPSPIAGRDRNREEDPTDERPVALRVGENLVKRFNPLDVAIVKKPNFCSKKKEIRRW